MPRIRSVNPKFFTDEAVMDAPPITRLFMIGLWTESFDDGVFEWKPVSLKAKLFPADNVDVALLLQQLQEFGIVRKFEAAGKHFGAIRNFQKYQCPKKPNSSDVLPEALLGFVGAHYRDARSVPNRFSTGSGIERQMEKEKEKEMEKEEEPSSSLRSEEAAAAAKVRDVNKLKRLCEQAAGASYEGGFGKIVELVEAGVDLQTRILPVIRSAAQQQRARNKRVTSWAWYAAAIADETRTVADTSAKAPLVWFRAGSPEFKAANKSRQERGEKPRVPITAKGRDGKGSYFDPADIPPLLSTPRSDVGSHDEKNEVQ